VSRIQRHNGLDGRPLNNGGINDQLIKRHLLIDLTYFKLISQLILLFAIFTVKYLIPQNC